MWFAAVPVIIMRRVRLMSRIRVGVKVRALRLRVLMCSTEALGAMERHKYQAEAVEGRNEYAQQHTPIRKRSAGDMRLVHCFDQRILGKESRGAGRADQRERSNQAGPIGD